MVRKKFGALGRPREPQSIFDTKVKREMFRGNFFEAVVNAPALNIRANVGQGEPIIGTLHAGDKVLIREMRDHWYGIIAVNDEILAKTLAEYPTGDHWQPMGYIDPQYLTDITRRDYLPLEDGAVG